MSILWEDDAQDQLFDWVSKDRKTALKIKALIHDIQRNGPARGIGKPEPLRYRKGWSRRIDDYNRLVYMQNKDGIIIIASCKGHYED